MTRFLVIVFLLTLPLSAQVPKHSFDSPKSDTATSGMIKPSHWDDYLSPQPDTALFIFDEFISGSLTTGAIGNLRWSIATIDAATINQIAGVANHPGICSLAAGTGVTTTGGSISMTMTTTGTVGTIDTANLFDVTFLARLGFDNDSTYARIGICNSSNVTGVTAPADGLYFDTRLLETQWFATIRNSTVGETRTAVASTSTSWALFRIRRLDFATDSVGFSINGGTELRYAVNHANFPNISMSPHLMIWNGDRARAQAILVDYYQLVITVSR